MKQKVAKPKRINPAEYLRRRCIIPVQPLSGEPMMMRARVKAVRLVDGGTTDGNNILAEWYFEFELVDVTPAGYTVRMPVHGVGRPEERPGFRWLDGARW